MSNTLQRLKDAQLAARKGRLATRATLLTTVIGEAEMAAKNDGNRETTDADVIETLKRFEKNLVSTINAITNTDRVIQLETSKFELQVIREFLPEKLTDLQVQKDIGTAMQELGIEKAVQKDQGAIVKILRAKYGDQFDGKQVSDVFKAMIR